MFRLNRQLIETHRAKAALTARRVESLLSPLAAIMLALHHAITSWQGDSLILAGNMSLGLSSAYLSYFTKLFKPIQGDNHVLTAACQDANPVVCCNRSNACRANELKGE
jgi:ABC-type multidrug transport system fused ATPase/permease subunit